MIFALDEGLYLAQVKHDEFNGPILGDGYSNLLMGEMSPCEVLSISSGSSWKELSLRGEVVEKDLFGLWTQDHYWKRNTTGDILLTLLLVLPTAPEFFA